MTSSVRLCASAAVRRLRGVLRGATGRGERGDGATFLLVSVAALICAVGLVVDGGGRMYAIDDARYVAQQAARAAGQEVDRGALRSSSVSTVSRARAQSAGEAVLAASGAVGTVAVAGDGTVTVTVRGSYSPKFLVFLGTLGVEGKAHAHPTLG